MGMWFSWFSKNTKEELEKIKKEEYIKALEVEREIQKRALELICLQFANNYKRQAGYLYRKFIKLAKKEILN